MEAKRISEFAVDDTITAFFSVRKREVREFTRGKFLSLELGDASGRIPAVVWEPDQFALEELAEGMVVKAAGKVTEYNGRLQLTITRIRLAAEDEYRLEDILPHSKQPLEQRRARILTLTRQIDNSHIRRLVESFWEDQAFFARFLAAAAGKLWHHACVGGLSEHSANVGELALRVAAGYDFLNRDYLIFGGLLHDLGKVNTYAGAAAIDYTDEGRLVGHICIADVWVCERAARIEGFPPALLTKLRHLLLSHQGEFETPVRPMMPEAFVLYYCDEIDSKLGAMSRIRERQGKPGWSEYVKLIDRFLYFDDTAQEPR
ncbi:MAG TPA: OB-fold nucleic acid binding domain-containing protein [candidate division Zixibacteria bacterium]|nr:OB-fold nucleic acid binding domain-containing protein [candidate division Zixibacteria bacterium]